MAYVIRRPSLPLPAGDYYTGRRAEVPALPWGSVPVISGRGPAMDEHAGYHGYGQMRVRTPGRGPSCPFGCYGGYGQADVVTIGDTETGAAQEEKRSLAPWFIVGGLAVVGIIGVIAFAPKR